MTTIEDKTFKGVTIVMDGTYFHNCTFTECTLIYNGGDYGWVDCVFNEPNILKFSGAADRTINYLRAFHKLSDDLMNAGK